MSSPHSDDQQQRRRRLIITLTATGLVIAVLAGIGIYGLITGPRDTDNPGDRPTASTAPVDPTDPNGPPREAELPALPRTNNPETYVRAVAEAL